MCALILGGTGLYALRDISLGLLEELRRADEVYIEEYTSVVPGFHREKLEELVGKNVNVLSREDVEGERLLRLLESARKKDVVLLAHGNPFIATTHSSIVTEALRRGVEVRVYPAPSVIDAVVASTGLHIYKFGRVATLTFPDEKLKFYPYTTYKVVGDNITRGLHTLLLLDLRTEEERAMTISEAALTLLRLEEVFKEGVIEPDMLVLGVSRALSPTEEIFLGTLREAVKVPDSPPPHSLVVPGLLHYTEIDFLCTKFGFEREVLEQWNKRVERRLQST